MKPPAEWRAQDWLLVADALERYLWDQPVTDGQELRLCQLIESGARMHGLASIEVRQQLDVEHFERYRRS